MAISDRITSIEEHIKESYQELEGLGIDTTGVNNNLENIPKLLDGYWETLPKVTGEGTSITLDNTKEGKMKINLKGNTSQEGTPTPETPQDIHVVSGDNSIDVCGKNLLDEEYYKNATYGSNVYKYTPLKFKGDRTLYFKMILKSGKTSISGLHLAVSNKNNPNLTGNKSYFLISNGTINPTASNYFDFTGEEDLYLDYYPTSVTPQDIFDTYNIMVSLENADYEPYNGDTYELDLGTLKMRGIGTYEDYFVRNSGKNLCDIVLDSSVGSNISYKTYTLKPNTQYTISTNTYLASSVVANVFADAGTSLTPSTSGNGINGSKTITSDSNGNITIGYRNYYNNLDYSNGKYWIMLNEGTIALPYEPYGTGQWCKYNAIEEVTLASSQFNEKGTTGTNAYYISTTIADGLNDNSVASSMSNKFGMVAFNNRQNGLDVTYVQNGRLYIRTKNNTSLDWSTNQNCKDWLDANSPIIDYILASPYLSLIESETLINQLDAIEKALGKDGQTNISQESNDLASLLNATALREME